MSGRIRRGGLPDLLLALRFPSSAADITSALGRQLKNQTTCLVGLRPPVAHAGVEDRPIYVPAYRSGDHPFDVKLDPGARRRTRTVSWCTTFTNCSSK